MFDMYNYNYVGPWIDDLYRNYDDSEKIMEKFNPQALSRLNAMTLSEWSKIMGCKINRPEKVKTDPYPYLSTPSLLQSGKEALVVDPKRFQKVYVNKFHT